MVDRVFLDANVLFAAAWGSRGLDQLWERARDGRCTLMASAYVIQEARLNLASVEQRTRLQTRLHDLLVVAEAPGTTRCPLDVPAKDQPLVVAALAARSTHLLTGDIRHFGPYFGQTVGGMRVLRPSAYLEPPADQPGDA